MPPSEMLRRVAIVRTDVSEERIAYIARVTGIGEVGTTLAVTSNRSPLRCSQLADSCHPDDRGDTFLRNVSSYKSHTT
jgi:hypothetical protein